MSNVLVFDVDGTLTGVRKVMQGDFAQDFHSIVKSYPVFLVTGSDMSKLKEQIPHPILKDVKGSFTCSGNEYWRSEKIVYQRNHDFSPHLIAFLEEKIRDSPYPVRTGKHIEYRVGTLNASVVGRNARPDERADYHTYDLEKSERLTIQNEINEKFPFYEANCGGMISIDVSSRGNTKAQVYPVIDELYPQAAVHFFGDNIREGGNDLPLAMAVRNASPKNKIHVVTNPVQTWEILQREFT